MIRFNSFRVFDLSLSCVGFGTCLSNPSYATNRVIVGCMCRTNCPRDLRHVFAIRRPEVFNPDRFINESGAFETPKEIIPFSAGRRNCIGMQLAKWKLFLYMANLVKKFTFLSADGENI